MSRGTVAAPGSPSTLAGLSGRVIVEAPPLEALKAEWNRAAEEKGNLYLTYEWMISLWESHLLGRGAEFLVLGSGDMKALVPFAPEDVHTRGFRFRQYGLVTNRYGRNHNDLLLRNEPERCLRATLEYVRSRGGHLFAVASLAEGTDAARLLRPVGEAMGFRVIEEEGVRSPYLALEGDWDGYLRDKSQNFRSDLKRKGNKARKAGVEIRRFTEPDSVPAVLEAIYAIETRSWKEGTQTSITTNPVAQAFYGRFLPRSAQAGWFESFLLYLEGRPVAYDMGVRFAGRYYMLKTSYDHALSEWSPGVVLREHVVRHLFEERVREHDFLGDDEPWKMRWTSTVRRHANIYLYDRSRWSSNLYSLLRRARSRGRPA